ncbi:MAG: SDR family NAD(P)-dependent oxidoreductase, partial [Boseongicola sp. SB0677_bin_26]|nr:SDR family NAD(P)-dependent oxidoreductase [Boseongicola sp. SB0677_bin_26]
MADLSGRTVFITGSGGLLGSTYVRRMLAAGARVVASDLPGKRADGLKERHGEDGRFRFYELDVSDEAAVEGIFLRVMGDGWEPNVVLNNAAVTG